MKITNLGVANTSLTSPSPLEEVVAAAGEPSNQGVAADPQGYTPSSALLRLIDLARQQPDVREERVRAASQRLEQGIYHTPASAAETAAAILDRLD